MPKIAPAVAIPPLPIGAYGHASDRAVVKAETREAVAAVKALSRQEVSVTDIAKALKLDKGAASRRVAMQSRTVTSSTTKPAEDDQRVFRSGSRCLAKLRSYRRWTNSTRYRVAWRRTNTRNTQTTGMRPLRDGCTVVRLFRGIIHRPHPNS
jgi:hypothetical protein